MGWWACCLRVADARVVLRKWSTTVSGPLVALYCWDTRKGVALDTGTDLRVSPFEHTVHCLIEVGVCVNSGFAIVHQPTQGGLWEIAYLLDSTGNQESIALVETVPMGAPRHRREGFVISASGVIDTGGPRPILRTNRVRCPHQWHRERPRAPFRLRRLSSKFLRRTHSSFAKVC